MRRLVLSFLTIFLLIPAACSRAQSPTTSGAPAEAAAEFATTGAPTTEAGALPIVDPLAVSGDIVTAGSSTLYPLSEAVTELFIDEGYQGQITIDSIGSGAGFERFCLAGETDVANASRPIRSSERESCAAIGRTPLEFRVGTDALAVAVNPGNGWIPAEGLTMEQLANIFSDQVTLWSDIVPEWPAEPIQRFSPGTDSGTYDYFVEAVMDELFAEPKGAGEEALLRAANVQFSEDDNVLVQGIEGSLYAIGYFSYGYYEENQDLLRAVAVDGVAPEAETVNDGTYPLARPLFIYSDAGVMRAKPQVAAYVNYYLTRVNEVVRRAGYFRAPPNALAASQALLAEELAR